MGHSILFSRSRSSDFDMGLTLNLPMWIVSVQFPVRNYDWTDAKKGKKKRYEKRDTYVYLPNLSIFNFDLTEEKYPG